MTAVPETQYARTSDGLHIAYQVLGDAPIDVLLFGFQGSHIELAWEVPAFVQVYRHLASFSRLILYDIRGSGMSDPLGRSDQPTLEEFANDMLAVLDAAGSERAALVANNMAGLMAIFFAASHPNRTSALVLDGCYARLARAPDYPWGVPETALANAVSVSADARLKSASSAGEGIRHLAPHASPEFRDQFARYTRSALSPGASRAISEMGVLGDVRALLPAIQAPTLVLYRAEDRFAGKPHAAYLADHIGGARLVEFPGQDNLIFVDGDADIDEIEEFLTGTRHAPKSDRVLATVLFTDIVGSTERAAELGDRKWRDLLDAHDRTVRRQLERFGGKEVNTVGDGFLATFDGPGRAIECACAIREAVRSLGIEVRVGVHTGECEVRGDDLGGIAVHVGARVSAFGGPGDVVVSRTVVDLVAGSGIEFEDRGEHALKGVPGTWRLYAVIT